MIGLREYRVCRATLPVKITTITPRTEHRVSVCPQIPFRILEICTYSPGPDLLVSDVHAGNITLFASAGSIPAETWDIVAITKAVEVAFRAGWRPREGERHPLYDRMRVTPVTLDVGLAIAIYLHNPTDEPITFRASIHGLTYDRHSPFDDKEDLDDVVRFDDLYVGESSGQTEPAPVVPPKPPASASELDVACRSCGAAPGKPCVAVPRGVFHPARRLQAGGCSGCPRKAWAAGMRAKCNFCGKETP
jgi:hypothetical protein